LPSDDLYNLAGSPHGFQPEISTFAINAHDNKCKRANYTYYQLLFPHSPFYTKDTLAVQRIYKDMYLDKEEN
jgi:hypothetical protein